MIIAALMDLMLDLWHGLLQILAFVDIPQSVVSVLSSVGVYLSSGVEVVAAYTHFSYLVTLLDFVIVYEIIDTTYIIIMWILRKIPMWGIS